MYVEPLVKRLSVACCDHFRLICTLCRYLSIHPSSKRLGVHCTSHSRSYHLMVQFNDHLTSAYSGWKFGRKGSLCPRLVTANARAQRPQNSSADGAKWND